jgi:hypothetical protein
MTFLNEILMNKYIELDVDSKKIATCVIESVNALERNWTVL